MAETASGKVRVRVAPSPTGDPHVGTAYIALFNYAFARATGGEFILRIEDTDRQRSSCESEQAIFDALHWVGLKWDEGPDVGGPYGPYRQSERTDIYRKYAWELVDKGAAYPCFCTAERIAALREEQKQRKENLGYDGKCKALSHEDAKRQIEAGVPHVIRLAVPKDGETRVHDKVRGEVVFQNSSIDDQVLLKSDGFPTYHLANVVDDHLMKISHVIRAEEWIVSTPKHLLLYEAFGWPAPVFIHMPLLRNKNKSKISKRKNPTSLLWYQEQGFLPEALLNFLALMGWSVADGREVFSLQEMVSEFSWERVASSAPVFDMQKLEWLDGVYIRNASVDELARRIQDHVAGARDLDEDMVRKSIPLVQERMKTLNDYLPRAAFLFAESVSPTAEELVPKKCTVEESRRILTACKESFSGVSEWTTAALEDCGRTLAEELESKPRYLFMCLRVAVTGTTVSPPLFESMELLGQDKCLSRMASALSTLGV